MGLLFIVVLFVLAMLSATGDPVVKPFVDLGMWSLCAGIMFWLGIRFSAFLERWEVRPHWRKVNRAKGRQVVEG